LKIIEFEDSLKVLRTIEIANAINGKIESGDLNHDDQFDLIVGGVTTSGQNIIQSFLNHDSTFVTGSIFRILSAPEMEIADFDSDGKADFYFLGKDSKGKLAHRIKTFAGDSIQLPEKNITHHAFGDFDRDGDLDLLLATDTLGIVLLENSALKNLAPALPTNQVSAFIYNRLFLYWDKPTDDHTPQPSVTYDLQLYRSGTEVAKGEFDTINGLRQTTSNGNLSTNNFHLMKASIGNYDFKIEGVDNSYYAKKILQGSAGGNCTLEEPKTITLCDKKPVKITEVQPVMWFSFTKGYLGKSASITANVKTDTLFSFLPQASNVCNAIHIYLIKAIAQDTLPVAQNFTGCEGTAISFKIGAEWSSVIWKDSKGIAKSAGNNLAYNILKDETIIGIGKNDHGCFIKQTENIKLSKPVLVLDGSEYKIVSGGSAVLGVSGARTYDWSPATGLNDVTSARPIASPTETTTYTVTGFDSLNCKAQAQVLVEVTNKSFIPNLFTPNGDGKNDELKIYGLSSARDFHFAIYNREGSLMYESTDMAGVSWDGSKNGTPQPSGLYYWKVQGVLDNGQPLFLNDKTKGSILLVR
jgi:gliding motility-associated-like protein